MTRSETGSTAAVPLPDQELSEAMVEWVESLLYEHRCFVFDNHDGDSLQALIHVHHAWHLFDLCRLLGVDTFETDDRDPVRASLAREGRQVTEDWLAKHAHEPIPVRYDQAVRRYASFGRGSKGRFPWPYRARMISGEDKYGRTLLRLVCATDGECLNDTLLVARSTNTLTLGYPLARAVRGGRHQAAKLVPWVLSVSRLKLSMGDLETVIQRAIDTRGPQIRAAFPVEDDEWPPLPSLTPEQIARLSLPA